MRPLCLKMTAFGPYVEEQIIDFAALEGRTLFLITGPTGAGKTTLFDAIAYALYGESSGKERDGEALRSDFAPPELSTEVVFDFSLAGRNYRVTRSPKQLRPKLRGSGFVEQAAEACLTFIDEPARLPIDGVREVNERIVSLLGLKYEQFRQIMMIPQGEFRELLVADSKDRETILQKLFGTEFCAALQNELQQRERELGKAADTEKTIQEQLESQLMELLETGELAETTTARIQLTRDWQTEQHSVLALQKKQLQTAHEKTLVQQNACAKAQTDNGALLALQQTETLVKTLETKRPEIETEKIKLAQAEAALALLPQEEEGKSLRAERNNNEQALRKAEQEKEKTVVEAAAAEQRLDALMKKEPERETARREIARLEALQPRVVEGETLRQQVRQLTVSLAASRQQTMALQEKRAQLAVERKSCDEQAAEKSAVQQQLHELASKKERLVAYKEKLVDLLALQQQTAALQAQKTAVDQRAAFAKTQRETAETVLVKMNENYFSQAAVVLARNLAPDAPCPVCGAVHHPAPAMAVEDSPAIDEGARTKQEKAVRELREHETSAVQGQATLTARLQADNEQVKRMQADLQKAAEKLSPVPENIKQTECFLTEQIKSEQTAKERLLLCEQAETKLALLDKQQNQFEEAEKAAVAELTRQTALLPEKERLLRDLDEQIPESIRSTSALTETIRRQNAALAAEQQALTAAQQQAAKLHTEAVRLTAVADELTKGLANLDRQLAAAQERFNAFCRQHGFADLSAYRAARDTTPLVEQMRQHVQQFEEDWQKQTALLEDNRKKAVGIVWQDEAVLAARLTELQQAEKTLQDEHSRLHYRLEAVEAALTKVVEHQAALLERQEAFALVADLSRVSRGMGANTRKISFERYVLAAYFEEVLQAANGRLRQMTNERYEMRRRQEQNKGNGQSGLDIDVLDNYTGRERPAKTLSGGESFKASLALALGLADVVQAHAGGVSLDTIFIDEGFGTLDPESLDGAIRCLIDLQRNGRLVGIISHVPELKETIDAWLLVESARSGSRANFCIK